MNVSEKMARSVRTLGDRGVLFGRMIKFSHSIFALPFALSAVVLAHRAHPVGAVQIFWILVAMVGARSAAMGFNRIADAEFDKRNPRTANRAIPAGDLSMGAAIRFVLLFSALFVLAAAMLGRLCFYLSFPVLGVLFGYSYTKRFTRFCHLYLGFAISLAPMGAWIALTNSFSWGIAFLSLALMTHIAGFDIIYACQDTDFDTCENLFSLPSLAGVRAALWISSLLHVVSVGCFILVGVLFGLNIVYGATVAVIAVMFVIEHLLVSEKRMDHINIAFFNINSMISVVLFFGILLEEISRIWL